MTLPLRRIETVIAAHAVSQPGHLALRFHDQTWTYAALCADARRAALLCAAGVKPGDVVAATGTVSGDIAVSALACIMANAVYFYLSPLFAPPEMAVRGNGGGAARAHAYGHAGCRPVTPAHATPGAPWYTLPRCDDRAGST